MNPNWLNDQRLNQIGWDKRTFLMNWVKEHSGLGQNEMLSSMMALSSSLQQKNLNFSKEESAILNQILLDAMSPAEKQRLELLQTLLKKQ
ncbi:MAG: hypothetical protein J6D02_03725 [Lachnospira sp.]|nr:hypothetical protein [Lachnospira sp.]